MPSNLPWTRRPWRSALARIAGWHNSWRSPFVLMARDFLLPFLWGAGWLGNTFVWRGNAMDIAGAESTVPRLRFGEWSDYRARWTAAYRRWLRRGADILKGESR